jgi:protein-S-isoprenylcysteine O-methyltransferase Ste14
VFWALFLWAVRPESRVVRDAWRAQRKPDAISRDPSFLPLIVGQQLVMVAAVLVAIFAPQLAIRHYRYLVFAGGLVLLVVASILRRHCFRMLGTDFRGAVTVRAGQPVVERGAYRYLRHPSYAAGLLLHIALGLALGNWGSLAIILLAVPPLFAYRMHVEERALLERIGAPYAAYMARTKRLIPRVW